METPVNPEVVINDLLEQNKQLTFQVSMLRAALAQATAQTEVALATEKEPTKRGK